MAKKSGMKALLQGPSKELDAPTRTRTTTASRKTRKTSTHAYTTTTTPLSTPERAPSIDRIDRQGSNTAITTATNLSKPPHSLRRRRSLDLYHSTTTALSSIAHSTEERLTSFAHSTEERLTSFAHSTEEKLASLALSTEEKLASLALSTEEKLASLAQSTTACIVNAAGDRSLLAESFLYLRDKSRHALKLYHFEDIPTYLQDNEFIRTGYRTAYSAREAWLSVWHWHNETGNIWTHLVGFMMFVGLLVGVLGWGWGVPDGSGVWDYAVLGVFIASACKCFLFSTLFHIHFCNNPRAFRTFGCLDYAGISLLIAGSTAVVTYYSYYCHTLSRRTWLSLLAVIALVGLIGPMFRVWSTPRFRVWRTGIYLGSGVVSGVPVIVYLLSEGVPEVPSGIWGFLAMIFIYIFGAILYAFRIPERYLPGKFDIFFNSHQWWHVAVVSAAVVHYRSCMELVEWRLEKGRCLTASAPVDAAGSGLGW